MSSRLSCRLAEGLLKTPKNQHLLTFSNRNANGQRQFLWRQRYVLSTATRHLGRISNVSYDGHATRCFHSSGTQLGLFEYSMVDYIVYVKTGDQFQAGTDANVRVTLHGENGEKAENITLDYLFRDDFERGQLDTFQLKKLTNLKDIHKIELWRDDAGIGSDWFVDYVEIEDTNSRKRFMFPIFRWIKGHRKYAIRHMDNSLPQFDSEKEEREEDLNYKRREYHCHMKIPGGPAQVGFDVCGKI